MGGWVRIGMKQISDPDGDPGVFVLERDGDGVWLSYDWTEPDERWDPDRRFVFRLRKWFLVILNFQQFCHFDT